MSDDADTGQTSIGDRLVAAARATKPDRPDVPGAMAPDRPGGGETVPDGDAATAPTPIASDMAARETAPPTAPPTATDGPDRPALAAVDVVRTFRQAGQPLAVLRGVNFVVNPGEMVALVGPSGAGKSTLLQICGLLEKPDGGDVLIEGAPCGSLSDARRTRLRLHHVGFVYQHHHLLPEFSALENVQIPQMIAGLGAPEARKRAHDLLAMVGLSQRASHRPARLSGGEQQRVAMARALANAPRLLIADEPTGNLDPHTAEDVFDMLQRLVRGVRLAALVATHNLDLAARMDRVLLLRDGVVEDA